MSFMGHNVSAQVADSTAFEIDSILATVDSIVADSVPEWYVAPEIPLSLRAPRRATASTPCSKVAAIRTYDINSQLTTSTYYEYDNAGRVISTTVWTHNADGSQTGKSKQEYGFDVYNNQISTVVYDWDNTMNIWHGVSRYEYVYDAEHRMLSNTEYAWINNEWKADTKYTWSYDAEGREAEYYAYQRDAVTNELVPVNGFVYTWIDDTQKSLEIIYTAYANNAWSAGTKKEWSFDASGNLTQYTESTISNGNWIGSSKETWTYEGPNGELTLHEKYGWASSDWSKTLKEETEYSGAKIIRIENYTYANGVPTGTKKETWTYGGPSGQLTLHEQFGWASSDWSKTLKEETEYSGANVIRIENYTYANGVPTGTKKELTTYTSGKKTQILTFAWENGAWVDSNRETWEFNGPSSKQTKHEKCEWENGAWTIMVQENTTYNGNTTIVENYERIEGVLTGTKKESNTVVSGKPTETIIYDWNGSWVESTKENWAYTNNKLTKHEFYEWTGDWTKTLEENTTYSGANITKIENYERVEGVWTGTQKEEYAYTSGKKTSSIVYAWDAAASKWVEDSREAWGFTSGKQTLYETYAWNGNWVKTLQENTTYDGENITKIENYALVEGVWAGTQKEEYTYTSGEKTRTIASVWAENDWVFSTKNEAGYWDGNVEVSATNYAWNGSTWIGTGTRTKTTYDGTKVIEKLTENWPSGATEWTNAAITTNTYNEEGVNILTYNGTWNGSRWTVYSMARLDIIKDAAGHELLNASWTCGSDSDWVGVKKDTAAYTATNKPLYVASYKSWANGDWVPYAKSEYTYDASDRQTLLMQYEGKNGKWVNKTKVEQRYDMFGNRTLSQSFKWLKNTWVGVYKYEYTYDDAGRQTRQAYYEWSSGQWSGFSCSGTEYDDNGNIIATMSFQWMNNTWQGLLREENVYDEKLRVVEYIRKNWKNNNWANSRRFIYTYDQLDRLVSTRQYRWYNNVWELCEVDDKEYDQLDNKLLHKLYILWNNHVIYTYSDDYYYYDCDPHFYTVGFMNYDGSGLAYQILTEGETPAYAGETPTKPSTSASSYTFDSWSPAIAAVTSDVTYIATFSETKNKYTITWKNDDGTTIDQTEVIHGEQPMHADAMKENTAQYTYTFTGWSPAVVAATSDAAYTAQYTSTVNKYLITFKNGETELQSSEVEFGTVPVYEGATPTKDEDAQYTYDFLDWDEEIVAVTGAKTYTATFSGTVKKYTVTFQNDDETVLQSSEVAYGETPEYEGATPTKPSDAQDTYNFAGWDPQVVAVTGNATYTAQYTSTVNKYTIIFENYDGAELQTGEVAYGETPVYTGATPTKPADAQDTYTFAGWSPEIVSVTGTATYTATFTGTTNKYLITFKNGETELQSSEVEYGETPSYTGATPTKPATAQYTYTFSGWDPAIVAVTGIATYEAQFSSTVNKYTIKFMNGETELQSSEVEYGTEPVYGGATPTKDATAQYTYTFSGWDEDIIAVTGSKTYTAQFNSTVNKYVITFMNGTTELQSSEVEFGTVPTYEGTTPTKDATPQYTYAFSGWDEEIAAVTGAKTYTATFSSTINKYAITFMNGETELQSSEVEYGETPVYAGAEPSKPADAQYTYNFAGWDPQVVAVTEEKTYEAQFTGTVNTYAIIFQNYDGTELQNSEVAYGQTPVYGGATPTKDATAQYTYTFTGWDKEIASVTGDETYTAQFSSEVNSYVITFMNGTDILQTGEVAYGETPIYSGVEPTKAADETYSYVFAGWDEDIAAVTGAKTYTATFTGVKGTYTITFYFGDGVTILSQMELAYGEMPEMTLEPARLADPEFSFTFAGWEPAIAPVTADADYVAVYTATTNSYTIIFRNDDGTELQREVLEYGILPIYAGEEPTKEEDERYTYEFAGWKPAVDIAKADAVYTATYTATKKKKQGIEDVVEAGMSATKIYIEGNIYILRAGHAYAPDGTKLY